VPSRCESIISKKKANVQPNRALARPKLARKKMPAPLHEITTGNANVG